MKIRNIIIQLNQKSLVLLSPGILAACLGCLLLFYPWLIGDKSMMWGGDFDNNLIYWIFAWDYHVLFERWDWLNFWNANSFYPHMNTLAFSESLISGQFLYAPLRFVGISPLLSMHLTLIGLCFIGCILSDYGLRKISFNWSERFLLVYICHFGLSMVGFLPGHLQFFGFQFAPPFLIFLYLYLKNLEPIYGYWATAIFLTAVSFSTYFAPMAFAVAMPYTLFMLFCHLRKTGYKTLFKKILDPKFSIPVVSTLTILYFIQLRPYTKFQKDFQRPSLDEIELYSAQTFSILHLSTKYSKWYAEEGYANGEWEYAYFPGYLSLFCSVLMLCYYFFKKPKFDGALGFDRRFIGFVIYVFALSWALSLGPSIDIDNYNLPGPYSLFNFLFPPFGSMRAPGRFGMFFGIFFAISILFAFRFMKKCKIYYIKNLSLIFVILAIVENLPQTQIYPFDIADKDSYEEISGLLSPNEPLLVLPIAGADHMDTIRNLMEHLKGSTIHWARIPSGYGSQATQELQQFIQLDNLLKNDASIMNQIYSFCDQNSISNILIFLNKYPSEVSKKIKESIYFNKDILYQNHTRQIYLIENKKK